MGVLHGGSGTTTKPDTNQGGNTSNKPSNGGGSTTNKPSPSPKPNQNSNSGVNQKPNSQTGTIGVQNPSSQGVPTETHIEDANVKSSNNYLKSIELSLGRLSPDFYRETFEYEIVDLPEDIMEIEVNALAEDDKASVSGIGKIALNKGENNLELAVTAQNGNVRQYILKVNKKEEIKESDLRLDTLEISAVNDKGEFSNIDFGFDKEKFEYNISVPGNIIDLDINPTVQREGIIVETFGEKNLKEGENLVEIILTSQADSSIQTRYNIRVNKESIKEVNASVSKKDETWKIIVLIILITILLAELALYLYLLKRKKR